MCVHQSKPPHPLRIGRVNLPGTLSINPRLSRFTIMIPFAQKQNRFVTTCCMVERKISDKRRTIHTGGNNVGKCASCFGSNNERTHSSRKQSFLIAQNFVSVQLYLLFVVSFVCFSRPSPGFFSLCCHSSFEPIQLPSLLLLLHSLLTHSLHRHLLHIDHALNFPDFRTCGLSSLSPSFSLSHSLQPHTYARHRQKRRKHSSRETSLYFVCVSIHPI